MLTGRFFVRLLEPRSKRSARDVLGLDRVDVVYPGPETFALGDGFRAVSVARLLVDLDALA